MNYASVLILVNKCFRTLHLSPEAKQQIAHAIIRKQPWTRYVPPQHNQPQQKQTTFYGELVATFVRNELLPLPVGAILDIGCGDGHILTHLQDLKIPLWGLETQTDWSEPTMSSAVLQMRYWDNVTFPEDLPTCLALVLCMVAMHHMTEETLDTLWTQVRMRMTTGGYVLIKEHDSVSDCDYEYIALEHQLYHMSVVGPEGPPDTSVCNLKSHRAWTTLLERHGFRAVHRFTRFLEHDNGTLDRSNVTRLYWALYVAV